MLQAQNPLAIDDDILYDDATHSYGLRSKPGQRFRSVTEIASSRMPPFDSAVISAKLAASGRGKYKGKTAEEIQQSWKQLAALGTALHAEIEAFYNGGPEPAHSGFSCAAKVLRDDMGLEPWRAELKMASAATSVAGTADMILKTKGASVADGVTMVDWKRTSEAPEHSKYDACRMELSHVPGGKFWKFAVQLNFYAELLWDTCGVPTTQMLVVLLHPNGKEHRILRVPRMPEVHAMYHRLAKAPPVG